MKVKQKLIIQQEVFLANDMMVKFSKTFCVDADYSVNLLDYLKLNKDIDI